METKEKRIIRITDSNTNHDDIYDTIIVDPNHGYEKAFIEAEIVLTSDKENPYVVYRYNTLMEAISDSKSEFTPKRFAYYKDALNYAQLMVNSDIATKICVGFDKVVDIVVIGKDNNKKTQIIHTLY